MGMLREIIHGSYLYASASRHASPGAAVVGGVHYVSTNNNTASRHKLSPGEPVDKRAVWLLINNQRTTPVRRACSPTGPGDADANKGPRAVWSGRPTQREEGGRQQKGRQPLQPRKIFSFSALSEPQ